MYRGILCLVLCSAVLVQGEIKDCGSKIGSDVNVTVTNCKSEDKECILRRGKDVTITITFNLDRDVKEVNAEVHGIIGSLTLPFKISQPDGCSKSGLTCPLAKSSGPFEYTSTLSVLKVYPRLAVTVKWELKNENDEDIICVLIPSKIA